MGGGLRQRQVEGYEHKKPDPLDFGITPKDYALYRGSPWFNVGEERSGFIAALVIMVLIAATLGIFFGHEAAIATLVFGILPAGGASPYLGDVIAHFKRFFLLRSPIVPQIKLYEEALKTYNLAKEEVERQQREAEKILREAEETEQETERQRRAVERRRLEAQRQQQRIREQYWESMDGVEFERELGGLFQVMGYGVEMTPRSGDQGVDLVLRKDRVTTVVQCKAQKARASSPIARELLGSMVAFGAQKAILACTGGFTRGVREFVEEKPISLLDSSDIARMAEGVGGVVGVVDKLPKATRRGRADQEREPSCPKCRRRMVLRRGSRGDFWGCPAFPRCRGTREVSGYYFR